MKNDIEVRLYKNKDHLNLKIFIFDKTEDIKLKPYFTPFQSVSSDRNP